MNPDQMPAAHLPAPLPSPAALLRRTQGALGLLREVVQESSAEYWYERGKKEVLTETWLDAESSFQRCLKLDPSHWRAEMQSIIPKLHLGQTLQEQVINAFRVLPPIECYCDELNSAQWDAVEEHLLKQFKLIRYHYYSSTETEDDLPLSIAIFYWINNAHDKADEFLDYTRPLREGNKYRYLISRLSGLLNLSYNINMILDAVDDFSWSKLSDDNSIDFYYLGIAKQRRRFYDNYENLAEILQCFNQAITVNPYQAAFYIGRGVAKEQIGTNNEALDDYVLAVKLAVEQKLTLTIENAYEHLAVLYDKLGHKADCQAVCNLLIEFATINNLFSGLEAVMKLYEKSHNYEKELEICDKIIERSLNNHHSSRSNTSWRFYRQSILARMKAAKQE